MSGMPVATRFHAPAKAGPSGLAQRSSYAETGMVDVEMIITALEGMTDATGIIAIDATATMERDRQEDMMKIGTEANAVLRIVKTTLEAPLVLLAVNAMMGAHLPIGEEEEEIAMPQTREGRRLLRVLLHCRKGKGRLPVGTFMPLDMSNTRPCKPSRQV